MKKKLVLLALGALTLVSCQTQPKKDYSWIKKRSGCSFRPIRINRRRNFIHQYAAAFHPHRL